MLSRGAEDVRAPIDLNNFLIFGFNSLDQFVVWTGCVDTGHRALGAVAVAPSLWSKQRNSPLTAQEQVRAQSGRLPKQPIIDGQCLSKGNTRLTEDSIYIPRARKDCISAMEVEIEISCSFLSPGTARLGVYLGFFPDNPVLG